MFAIRPSFRLRTLFVVISIIALGFGHWRRSQELRDQALGHYYQALRSGYRAIRSQCSPDYEWEERRAWEAYCEGRWRWRYPVVMNRTSIENSLPYWRESIEQTRQFESCLKRVYLPGCDWVFEGPEPEWQLPRNDAHLPAWWHKTISAHVRKLGLDQPYGSGRGPDQSHLELGIGIWNGASREMRHEVSDLRDEVRQIMDDL